MTEVLEGHRGHLEAQVIALAAIETLGAEEFAYDYAGAFRRTTAAEGENSTA